MRNNSRNDDDLSYFLRQAEETACLLFAYSIKEFYFNRILFSLVISYCFIKKFYWKNVPVIILTGRGREGGERERKFLKICFTSENYCFYFTFISMWRLFYYTVYYYIILYLNYQFFITLLCIWKIYRKNVTAIVRKFKPPYHTSCFLLCAITYKCAIYRLFIPFHRARNKFLANAKIVSSDTLDRFCMMFGPFSSVVLHIVINTSQFRVTNVKQT